MAVDLFATTEASWWNALTCRTGGAETNKRLAQSAIASGKRWNVYGEGVTLSNGMVIRAESEDHVFELCGVPYLPPEMRP
jgi:DNA polymerase/3'-5' exonuclease PolX